MFKFKIKQVVYYLKDNIVHSSTVACREFVDVGESWGKASNTFGVARKRYETCHGVFAEERLFKTKAALLRGL